MVIFYIIKSEKLVNIDIFYGEDLGLRTFYFSIDLNPYFKDFMELVFYLKLEIVKSLTFL